MSTKNKIYGLRLVPQSTSVLPGKGALIYVHGRVTPNCSDFFYIFGRTTHTWAGHILSNEFTVTYGENGVEDPLPWLREIYGEAFIDADLKSGLVLLHGDNFSDWGPTVRFDQGALLLVFKERPSFELLQHLYRDRHFELDSDTWPAGMTGLLHMWDDIFWQYFSPDPAHLRLLIQTHEADPKIKMYFVDIEREYPDPSNEKLQPATLENFKILK